MLLITMILDIMRQVENLRSYAPTKKSFTTLIFLICTFQNKQQRSGNSRVNSSLEVGKYNPIKLSQFQT